MNYDKCETNDVDSLNVLNNRKRYNCSEEFRLKLKSKTRKKKTKINEGF